MSCKHTLKRSRDFTLLRRKLFNSLKKTNSDIRSVPSLSEYSSTLQYRHRSVTHRPSRQSGPPGCCRAPAPATATESSATDPARDQGKEARSQENLSRQWATLRCWITPFSRTPLSAISTIFNQVSTGNQPCTPPSPPS